MFNLCQILKFFCFACSVTSLQGFTVGSVGSKVSTRPAGPLCSSITPPDEEGSAVGATERLLLERSERQNKGIVQEIGRTVKKDGLDDVRAVVWGAYSAAQNIVFPALALALFAVTAMNLVGYGYYFGVNGDFHFDTLTNINQMNQMQAFQAETDRFTIQTTMMR